MSIAVVGINHLPSSQRLASELSSTLKRNGHEVHYCTLEVDRVSEKCRDHEWTILVTVGQRLVVFDRSGQCVKKWPYSELGSLLHMLRKTDPTGWLRVEALFQRMYDSEDLYEMFGDERYGRRVKRIRRVIESLVVRLG